MFRQINDWAVWEAPPSPIELGGQPPLVAAFYLRQMAATAKNLRLGARIIIDTTQLLRGDQVAYTIAAERKKAGLLRDKPIKSIRRVQAPLPKYAEEQFDWCAVTKSN